MAPHTPTSGQITKLNALKAAVTAASATVTADQATLATDQAALAAAQKAMIAYEGYVYGGNPVGALDIGTQAA